MRRYTSRLWVIDAILLFVLVLWTVQLFLFITGLDGFLEGRYNILWPAAISSIVLAVVSALLARSLRSD